MSKDKLGDFLRDVSNWGWDEFVRAEHDMKYTSNQAIIFALVRACAMQKMAAIKIAVDRLDGKLKTPIKVEMPKVFYLFPHASLPEGEQGVNLKLTPPAPTEPFGPLVEVDPDKQTLTMAPAPDPAPSTTVVLTGETLPAPTPPPDAGPDPDLLPSMGLRETLAAMSDYPRELPQAIIDLALKTEQWLREQAGRPDEIPKVKSVVAAHLLVMAHNRNLDAINEVFDQIDGKLVETLQVLGEDIYITIYSNTAPPGAYLNKNGVLQIEAPDSQDMWASKLGKDK